MNMNIIEVIIVKAKSETVLARADVHFEGFLLKGFKVLKDPKTNKEFVTPPSYHSFSGWRQLFKTDKPEDWQEISRRILEAFNHQQIKESLEETDTI